MIRSASDFEDLTFAELKEAVEASVEKESDRAKADWVRDAWFASWLIMAITGRKIKPFDLLPNWITGKKAITEKEKDELRKAALKELHALKKRLKIED